MNPNVKKLWVEALRSTKYIQGRCELRSNRNEFCPLGILCDIYLRETGQGRWWRGSFEDSTGDCSRCALPMEVQKWAELDSNDPLLHPTLMITTKQGKQLRCCCTNINDGGATFAQFADLVEANL